MAGRPALATAGSQARRQKLLDQGSLTPTDLARQAGLSVSATHQRVRRLERRGLIHGRWIEKSGERRRRFYRLTAQGERTLASQRRSWKNFLAAINRVARLRQA